MSKALKKELDSISFSEISGKNTSADAVTSDLDLFDGRNTQFGYADVSWKTSDGEVINNAGVISYSDTAKTATITAEFTYQDYPDLKGELSFTLTVLPSSEQTAVEELDSNKIRIFIAGDSTACNYPHTGENNRYPQTGWGQVLGELFNDEILVVNRARSGRSTKSFMREENYKFICENIQKGDYLFIQFAHNDSKAEDSARYTSPCDGTYQEHIYRLIETARKVGANPVLCSSITRNLPTDTSLVPYSRALKDIAEEENIAFLDIYKRTHEHLDEVGDEAHGEWHMRLAPKDSRFADNEEFKNSQYYDGGSSDNTHLNINGAREVAKIAVEELKKINHSLTEYLKS